MSETDIFKNGEPATVSRTGETKIENSESAQKETELQKVAGANSSVLLKKDDEEGPVQVEIKLKEVVEVEEEGEEGGYKSGKHYHAPPKKEFNHKLSFVYATVASLFFGMADYLIALLSIRKGMKWMYPTYMITTVVWSVFHIGRWIVLNRSLAKEGKSKVPFWNKQYSSYCVKKTNVVIDESLTD